MTVKAIDLMMDGPHDGARSPVERVGDCGGGEDGFVRKSLPGQCQKVRREPGYPASFSPRVWVQLQERVALSRQRIAPGTHFYAVRRFRVSARGLTSHICLHEPPNLSLGARDSRYQPKSVARGSQVEGGMELILQRATIAG